VESAAVAVLFYVAFTDFTAFKIRNDTVLLLLILSVLFAFIDADANPGSAKQLLITRYVEEYNAELFALGKQLPERFMLVGMEELNDLSIQNRIFHFVGLPGRASQAVLNVGTAHDGADAYWF